MTLGSKQVNLILSLISFAIAVVFVIFFYLPKTEKVDSLTKDVETLHENVRDAQMVTRTEKKLKDNLEKLRKKQEQKTIAEAKKDGIRATESKLLATIEKIANDNKIDIKDFKRAGAANAPTPEPSQSTGIPSGTAGVPTPTTPNGGIPQTTSGGETKAFDLNVQGEYRSLMTFLFELRSTKGNPIIETFTLGYNSKDNEKMANASKMKVKKKSPHLNGYPVKASFTVKFEHVKGGSN